MVIGPLKAQLKLMEKSEADLQAQQTYLTGLIAEEQSRWTTFNAMLDEMGKAVEVKRGGSRTRSGDRPDSDWPTRGRGPQDKTGPHDASGDGVLE